MNNFNFVALDVETANQDRGSICSIGLVKVLNNEIVDTYYSLIDPEDEFDYFNIGIHGITPEMVKGEPVFPTVFPSLMEFIGDLPIVAHYAQFDTGAIRDACDKYDISNLEMKYFCSYYLAKSLVRKINYKLETLAKDYNIDLDHHNALSDSKACALLVLNLAKLNDATDTIALLNEAGYQHFGTINGNTWTGFRKKKIRTYKDFLAEIDFTNDEYLDEEHIFYNKNILFTGTLGSMTRKEAAQLVANVGGIPQKGINKETNFLVMGEQDLSKVDISGKSSKIKKAEEMLNQGKDIELVTENEFIKFLGQVFIDNTERKNAEKYDAGYTDEDVKIHSLLKGILQENDLDPSLLDFNRDPKKIDVLYFFKVCVLGTFKNRIYLGLRLDESTFQQEFGNVDFRVAPKSSWENIQIFIDDLDDIKAFQKLIADTVRNSLNDITSYLINNKSVNKDVAELKQKNEYLEKKYSI